MNTRTTAGLLTTEESRYAFRAAFLQLARARKLTAQHMALHAILMGKPLSRTFSPITNATKLANGQKPWLNALAAIHSLARPDAACVLLCGAKTLERAQAIAKGIAAADLEATCTGRRPHEEA
jgi:hypothetical protein